MYRVPGSHKLRIMYPISGSHRKKYLSKNLVVSKKSRTFAGQNILDYYGQNLRYR